MLIVEGDEWLSTLLVKFLGGEGFECEVAVEAREGLTKARANQPDCIICDVLLPDIDGFWVARRVRGERSRLASTPFAFLTKEDNPELRLQGLAFGADVFISPPFRHEEVVAQVTALIGMAERLRVRRDDGPGRAGEVAPAALSGDLAQLSVTTLLTMLEMERRTGRLTVSPPDGAGAEFEIVGGGLASARMGARALEPVSVMRHAVGWAKGSFSFDPTPKAVAAVRGAAIGPLLLEAMRLNDEAGR